MLNRPWLNVLVESVDQDQDISWIPCVDWEDGQIILEDAKGWSTAGRKLEKLLAHVDPRFLHHDEHMDKLLHGGLRSDGVKFPGGGGLRWGGLLIDDKEAVLRVLGSYEYKDEQEQYQQTIRFANFHKIAKLKDLNWSEKARRLIGDRLKVHCDCPAFRYFYAYTADQKGFGLYPEVRASNKTNPAKRGGICKHLHLVLKYLPTHAQHMAGELKAHYKK